MALQRFALAAILASASLGLFAQADTADHSAHHPEASAPAPAAPPPAPANTAGPAGAMNPPARMEQHMKAMREMHEKMAQARTPKEREALMAEHMKLMREGMAMMDGMKGMGGMGGMGAMPPQGNAAAPGATPAARLQALEQRVDMMQSMMQMMMDRMPAAPAAKP